MNEPRRGVEQKQTKETKGRGLHEATPGTQIFSSRRLANIPTFVLSVTFCSNLLAGFMLLASVGSTLAGTTNDLTTLLQRGLFEEEANRDLDAAIASYDALARQFDKNRQIAATAIFRLGECYRKLGKTNEAALQYERIVREFADQQTLATLSRQNLTGMGAASPDAAGPGAISGWVQAAETAETEAAALKAQLDQLKALPAGVRRTAIQENHGNPVLTKLSEDLADAEQKLVSLQVTYKDDHPLVSNQRELIKTIDSQIDQRIEGVLFGLELKRRTAEERAKALRAQAGGTPNPAAAKRAETPVLDDEEREIRRIQAMIQNSPDLINATSGDPSLTPLCRAASQGQVRVAEFLLNNGADINVRSGSSSWTALHHAVYGGHKKLAELLIARGADINAQDSSGRTPLYLSVERRFQSLFETLLAAKADPNLASQGNDTPLMRAVRNGAEATVAALLKQGADPNQLNEPVPASTRLSAGGNRDQYGSALHMAAARDSSHNIAVMLLTNRAKVDLLSIFGETPLHVAAAVGSTTNAILLLKAGAKVNATGLERETGGATPLCMAVSGKRTETVKLLLEQGADPNVTVLWGRAGVTPLMQAAGAGDLENTSLLLARGAKPNTEDSRGNAALTLAVNGRNPEVVKVLLANGADPNTRRGDGWPVLTLAVTDNADRDVAAALIAAKADVNAVDPDGGTPLHRAVLMKRKDFVEQLLAAGANPNLRNKEGRTPLDLAKGQSPTAFPGPGVIPRPGVVPVPSLPIPSSPTSAETASPADMIALLRQKGALDELPDFSVIKVKWLGMLQASPVIGRHTNDWNRVTLMETLTSAKGGEYADFSRILVHRPAGNGRAKAETITVNLLNATNGIDCTKDVWLEFGDVVEVPERDHPLDETPREVRDRQVRLMHVCLKRQVRLTVRGQTRQLELGSFSTLSSALKEPVAKSLLLSSSDFSRIKVTRKIPETGKLVEFITSVSPAPPGDQDLWLRDGDVIEVPEK